MEENSLFNYWFAYIFALGFCFWFPTYVIKNKGRGLPTWGLAFCIVLLFIFLPLLAVSLVRDIFPSVWLNVTSGGHEAPNVPMLVGSVQKMATLNKVYFAVSLIFIAIGAAQSCFSAWLLYIRHNRESLLRAIRLMWCSALMIVLAVGLFPLLMLGKRGFFIAYEGGLSMCLYIVLLMGITAYLRMSDKVAEYYPLSHARKRAK